MAITRVFIMIVLSEKFRHLLAGQLVVSSILIIFIFFITQVLNQQQQQQQRPPVPVVGQQAPQQQQQQQQQPIYKILIPNLPTRHYQFWLKNHPRAFKELQSICNEFVNPPSTLEQFQKINSNLTFEDPSYLTDLNHGKSVLTSICSKIDVVQKSCWGYETNCQIIHLMPECYGSSLGQAKSEQEQKIAWFSQADFGYILDRRKELSKYCSPDKYSNESMKSSLECTKYFKTCRSENLFMEFDQNMPMGPSLMYQKTPYKAALVGGWNCDLQLKRIQEEDGQKGMLQSWFSELSGYQKLEEKIPAREDEACDLVIDKQAFVLKLDSASNMYHYFCNFLNLYATIHLNNRFSDDNQIIVWDNQLPRSNFELMWSVFSRNKPMSIREFEGKRVCFKKVIFSLLPRMVNGLYYNTPLIPGCSKSGLFDAFNKHVLHRLRIPQNYDLKSHRTTKNELIRVTMINRSTAQRKLLNQNALRAALSNISSNYQVHLIDYAQLNLPDQLMFSQNSDILIGLHGAGLTNSLFLPDWAAMVELYNCKDKSYHDLARLRGVSYFTFDEGSESAVEKVPIEDASELKKLKDRRLVDHEKFSNYRINQEEFISLVERAIEKVKKTRMKYFQDLEKQLTGDSKHQISGLVMEPETISKTFKDDRHVEL